MALVATSEEPLSLPVGAEVSAKFKGAFCEAKIKKVDKTVKCRVNFKGHGTVCVDVSAIKGTIKVGATVEAVHPGSKQYKEASVISVKDCSSYTVTFDDGDERTLKRTQVCLKGSKHFREGLTIKECPLNHPEQFGAPVRKKLKKPVEPESEAESSGSDTEEAEVPAKPVRSRASVESESSSNSATRQAPKDMKFGSVIGVYEDKERRKWYPAMVVSPKAQACLKRVKPAKETCIRSFKDGKCSIVAKSFTKVFTIEEARKIELPSIKTAMEKAILYVETNVLPPHWELNRSLLVGEVSSSSSSEEGSSEEDNDNEAFEEKDRFVAQLYKFMDERGTPINKAPMIGGVDLNVYRLYKVVQRLGGFGKVTKNDNWSTVFDKMNLSADNITPSLVKKAYNKYLNNFDVFYKKLGFPISENRISSRKSAYRFSHFTQVQEKKKQISSRPVPTNTTSISTETASATDEGKRSDETEEQQSDPPSASAESTSKPSKFYRTTRRISSVSVSAEDQANSTIVKQEIKKRMLNSFLARARKALNESPSQAELVPVPVESIPETSEPADELERETNASVTRSIDSQNGKPPGGKMSTEEDVDDNHDENSSCSDGSAKRPSSSDEKWEVVEVDPEFKPEQKVKVRYGSSLFLAKIVRIETLGARKRYLIHYAGWNARYDEFVSRIRIVAVVDDDEDMMTSVTSAKALRSEAKKRRFVQSGRDSSCSQNGPSPGPDREGSGGGRWRHTSSCSTKGPKGNGPPGRKISRARQRQRSNSSEKVYSRQGPTTRGSQSTPTLDELGDGPKRRSYTKRQNEATRSLVLQRPTEHYSSDDSDQESVHSSHSSNRGTARGASSSPRSTPSYVAPAEFEEMAAAPAEPVKLGCVSPKKESSTSVLEPQAVKEEIVDTKETAVVVAHDLKPVGILSPIKDNLVPSGGAANIEEMNDHFGVSLENDTPPTTPPEMKDELDSYSGDLEQQNGNDSLSLGQSVTIGEGFNSPPYEGEEEEPTSSSTNAKEKPIRRKRGRRKNRSFPYQHKKPTNRTPKHQTEFSDDESGNHAAKGCASPQYNSTATLRSKIVQMMDQNPTRPSKFNFSALDMEDLVGEARINCLQQKLGQLRETYMQIKSELSLIERRRKRSMEKKKKRLSDGHTRHSNNSSEDLSDKSPSKRLSTPVKKSSTAEIPMEADC